MAKDTALDRSPASLESPQRADELDDGSHSETMADAPANPIKPVSTKTTSNGDATAHVVSAPESQTDTSAIAENPNNAISKEPPSKDQSGAISGSTASPYGTRSRNRTGTSRINYAEDKEMEMEFEVQQKDEGRKPGRANDADTANPEPFRTTASARRSQVFDAAHNNASVSVQKEQIPGTSTFSAVPTPVANGPAQPSKKRKANPPAITQSMQNSINTQHSAIGGQSVTRGASLILQDQSGFKDSNILTFDACEGNLTDGKMVADDGTMLGINDHVYLVCEPPGEPYYLGRIMEFLHTNNDPHMPIDSLRVNWYYRPKDIGRKVNDTRQVFASMHSDTSPLTALRGKCEIKHKSEVKDLDDLRKTKDSFWYEKLYDRYIHRYYEVIPTHQVVNVPSNVKKVLNDRWKYILVESGRGKELTSAVKSCKRCSGYCASNDSVDCAVCSQTYHMNCVRPPLLKKPSRGFAWACGPCSRAQERKLEARNTPNTAEAGEGEEEELGDEEEDDHHLAVPGTDTGRTSEEPLDDAIHPGTEEQIHQASLWPYRYLGVHCRVEDALDYDDRIYPRASSRLGPRHQANVILWHGRPVELVKPADIKKKYVKGGGKKDAKLSKETLAALEADKLAREKRPKWVMDEPVGYVHRGEDHSNDDPKNTAKLLFVLPKVGEISSLPSRGEDDEGIALSIQDREKFIDKYMELAKPLANKIGVLDHSCNFMDKALDILTQNDYDVEKSIEQLSLVSKKVLKEPELTAAELKKFEEAVGKYGSELLSVRRHVKTVSYGNIVRFYYVWKKSPRGQQIWGNFASRKGKKEAKKAEANVGKLQDDVADEHDDSAFDNEKAMEKRRGFQCKFCSTRNSRQWRRAPNTTAGTTVVAESTSKGSSKDKGAHLMVALCRRCAELWRRYAIQWEDIDEVAKKVAQAGGRAYKRRIDEELLKELVAANENMNLGGPDAVGTTSTSAGGTPVPPSHPQPIPEQQPPKKKLKLAPEKELCDGTASISGGVVTAGQKKKSAVEKHAGPPPPPAMPKPRILPCAICHEMEPMGDQLLTCRECRMSVHRNCYGVVGDIRGPSKWVCDMCSNDKNPQVSIKYECTLCSIITTQHDFVEPPKATHKKKTEKDREKERQEREISQTAADFYRKKQEEMNRPLDPREPLKRTINNNWVHVTCAVFTPEVKFGNAKALDISEGIPSIPSARYDELCILCSKSIGACIGCHTCRKPAHVECANQHGWTLGFDIVPVKGSRRDQFNIVNINGESGTMTAAIWCQDHMQPKAPIHKIHDIVDEQGRNALQLYAQNYKQADLTLTGTVRKANLVSQSTKAVTSTNSTRRVSTTNVPANGGHSTQSKEATDAAKSKGASSDNTRRCITCHVGVTPKWWPFPPSSPAKSSIISNNDITLTSRQSDNDSNNASHGPAAVDIIHVDTEVQDSDRVGADDEPTGENVALAAAALNENTKSTDSVEFQCHQCHFNKVVKEPTPPPPVIPPPQVAAPQPLPILSPINAAPAAPSPTPMQAPPHYSSWPPQTGRSPQVPYNEWPRPAPLQPQSVHVHQYASSPSPHMAALQHPNAQTYERQHTPGSRPSPQQNGYSRPPMSNAFSSSPHHMVAAPPTHMPNGIYASYPVVRPPQHLTNGGPAPRAPENPFSNHNVSHHRPPYGVSHGSPPAVRDQGLSREPQNQQLNGVRPNDGRVGGGASASPSLRNLLS